MSYSGRQKRVLSTPFYYGWVIIAMAAVTMFFTGSGQTYSFSLFINSFIQDFGWSRTLVSTLYSVATVISGSLMFLMGRLADRLGSRLTAIGAAGLLGLACFINSLVTNPVILFFGFFLARFSGQGTLGLSAGTLAPRWFLRRRALAIMLAGLGNTVAASVFPIMNAYLIANYGWRTAFRILGVGTWVLFIPLALLFLFNRPEDFGMKPDGVSPSHQKNRSATSEEYSFTQSQTIKAPAYWLIIFATFQFAMIATAKGFHFISIFNELGFADTFAARVMGLSPLAGLAAAILGGIVLDRIDRPQPALALGCLLQSLAFVLLPFARTPAMAYINSILSGFAGGLLVLAVGVIIPKFFGRKYIGGINGISSVVGVVGSALGPILYGTVYDMVGSYKVVILLSALLPFLAMITTLTARKPAH